jgi:hypothetical protein
MLYTGAMRITRQTETELVVESSLLWLTGFIATLTLPLFYAGLFGADKRILTPAAVLLLFAAICMRKSTFVFDGRAQVVHWRNRVFLSVSTGSLRFDEIRCVGIESTMAGRSGQLTYRLTLETRDRSIPLSAGYGGREPEYLAIKRTIEAFLKGDRSTAENPATAAATLAEQDLDASLRELMRTGRKIDAIALLRSMNSKMSLPEAKRRVEELSNK